MRKDKEDMEEKKKKKKKRRSLRYRIDRIIISVALIMMVVSIVVSANLYVSHYMTESQLLLSYMTEGLTESIDADTVEKIRDQVLAGYHKACKTYGDSFVHDYSVDDNGHQEYWDDMEAVMETTEYKELTDAMEKYAKANKESKIFIVGVDDDTENEVYLADVTYEGKYWAGSFSETQAVRSFNYSEDGGRTFYIMKDPGSKRNIYYGTSTIITSESGEIIGELRVAMSMKNEMKIFSIFLLQLVANIFCATILILFIARLITDRKIIKPIRVIDEAASSFVKNKRDQGGDSLLDVPDLKITTGDELQTLAESIEQMGEDINTYMTNLAAITAEKERIGVELSMAREIQASMVPRNFPVFPDRTEFDVYASMAPAKEVGGDLYDFFLIDEDHLALVIADVSGKGIPAALFMMVAKFLIKNTAESGVGPGAVFESVNHHLCENNDANMFVTAWMGVLTISTGKMVCANAGHEYPVICRKGGFYELLKDKHGFVLAGMDGICYEEYELNFNPGDKLFVYTDGVPEATNAAEEFYGMDRMVEVLNQVPGQSPKELLQQVEEGIEKFVAGSEQYDDVTMLAFHYVGK